MRAKILFTVAGLAVVATYIVGIIGLVVFPDANEIPTPGPALIAGVIAMFSTVGFFALGFVRAATISD